MTAKKSIYRALLVVSSVGIVSFCSWRGIGNMFIGFWLALIVVGLAECMNEIEDLSKTDEQI